MSDHGKPTAPRPPRSSRSAAFPAIGLVVVVLALGVLVTVVAGFPPEARETGQAPAVLGASRANPVPLGEEAVAGPLRITVTDVVTGAAAVDQLLAASPNNLPPAADATYVLASVSVRNDGNTALFVSNDDFGLTGSSGVIHRFLIAAPPVPALFATLEPGASSEGWLVFTAPAAETDLLLVFDSLSLDGDWSDATLALTAGAAIADASPPGAALNDLGRDPGQPAGRAEPVITEAWEVELVDVVLGAEVFDLVDYRTGALGAEDASNDTPWLALRFRVTNRAAGGVASNFPANAFGLADVTGAPLPDAVTLTAPLPDASGDYYPGASREGWVAFELPSYDPYLIVFDPYGATVPAPDPRFISYE